VTGRTVNHASECKSNKGRGCDCEVSMNLPDGKACADCAHFNFCKGFFGCPPENVTCDWAPSRFVPKLT